MYSAAIEMCPTAIEMRPPATEKTAGGSMSVQLTDVLAGIMVVTSRRDGLGCFTVGAEDYISYEYYF